MSGEEQAMKAGNGSRAWGRHVGTWCRTAAAGLAVALAALLYVGGEPAEPAGQDTGREAR